MQQIEEYQQDKFRLLQKDSGGSSVISVVDITRSGNAYVLIDGRLNDVFVAARTPIVPSTAIRSGSDFVPEKANRKARS